MSDICTLIAPEGWLFQMFSAKAAREGGIVRRSARSRKDRRPQGVRRRTARRGYHAVENRGQIVVFSNDVSVTVIR